MIHIKFGMQSDFIINRYYQKERSWSFNYQCFYQVNHKQIKIYQLLATTTSFPTTSKSLSPWFCSGSDLSCSLRNNLIVCSSCRFLQPNHLYQMLLKLGDGLVPPLLWEKYFEKLLIRLALIISAVLKLHRRFFKLWLLHVPLFWLRITRRWCVPLNGKSFLQRLLSLFCLVVTVQFLLILGLLILQFRLFYFDLLSVFLCVLVDVGDVVGCQGFCPFC